MRPRWTSLVLLVALLLPLAAGCDDELTGDRATNQAATGEPAGHAPASCEEVEATPVDRAATHDDLAGKTFRFVAVGGCAVPSDVDRSITFTTDGWSGPLTCNSMNGTWTLTGGALALGEGASTMMACPEGDPTEIEPARQRHVDVTTGGALVFTDDEGTTIAVTAAPTVAARELRNEP
jgi:heat shock protein HslJ